VTKTKIRSSVKDSRKKQDDIDIVTPAAPDKVAQKSITDDFSRMISVWSTRAKYCADGGLSHPKFVTFSVDEYHIHAFLEACEKLIATTENGIFSADSILVSISSSEVVHITKFLNNVSYVIRAGSFGAHYTQEAFESGIDRMGKALAARAGDTAKAKFINAPDEIVEKAYKAFTERKVDLLV
jgi:hypothetical protein